MKARGVLGCSLNHCDTNLAAAVARPCVVAAVQIIFTINAILSTVDDGCTVDMEGEQSCAGPFPYFKIVAMASIIGTGALVDMMTTACARRQDAQMQRRGSIHAAVDETRVSRGNDNPDLSTTLLK